MTESRIAVVTGGNRGIGLAICRGLAQAGFRVVLAARDADKARDAAAKLTSEGGFVTHFRLDVTVEAHMEDLVRAIDDRFGRLDVLVNNAGVLIDPKGSRALAMEEDVARQTMEVNLFGPLRLARALVPLMRRNGYGRIVNMSSTMAQLSSMEGSAPAYRLSKTALNALTRMLAAELQGSGVKVNCLSPGWVRTDMGGPSAPRSPEEGADTALWLAQLPVDGPSGGFFMDRKSIAW